MDDYEKNKSSDGVVVEFVKKQAVTDMSELERLKLSYEEMLKIVARSREEECDLIDEKCGRLMEQLKFVKLLNERYFEAIIQSGKLLSPYTGYSSEISKVCTEVYEILRRASYVEIVEMPKKDTK
jgi:hypothetical protein